jgi:hypothetical protein
MPGDYKIRRAEPGEVQFSQTLLAVRTDYGLPHVDVLAHELEHMRDVLFGRASSPLRSPYLELMEVATAYFCRAQEIDELIHRAEREEIVTRGSPLYKFRTGELRSFIELAKAAANLGSRRLTHESLLHNMREVT